MKGNEIDVEIEKISDEARARKVIISIRETLVDRQEEVEEAEKKLAEVLEKDIKDITDKDGRSYEW